jgi:hypothetical protein
MTDIPDPNLELIRVLDDQGIAVFDFTKETHQIDFGKNPLFRRPGNPVGTVLHNTTLNASFRSVLNHWTNEEPFPSHFAIERDGKVGRFVRLEYSDRATEGTLMHVSIEFRAVTDGDITDAQVNSAAAIAAFLNGYYGTPLAIATSSKEKGMAHHSLFVKPGSGGHAGCPGTAIIARKAAILAKAKTIAGGLTLNSPYGQWLVQVKPYTWIYTFQSNNTVTWRDPNTRKGGAGTWKIGKDPTSGKDKILISWTKSKAHDKWDYPLAPRAQTGKCFMSDGTEISLDATKI